MADTISFNRDSDNIALRTQHSNQNREVNPPQGILKGRRIAEAKPLSQKEARSCLNRLLFDKMTVLGSRLHFLKQQAEGRALLTKTSKNTFIVYIKIENKNNKIEKIHLKILRDGKLSDGKQTFNHFDEFLQSKNMTQSNILTRGNCNEEQRIIARAKKLLHGERNDHVVLSCNEGKDKHWQSNTWIAIKENGVLTLKKFEREIPKITRKRYKAEALKTVQFATTANVVFFDLTKRQAIRSKQKVNFTKPIPRKPRKLKSIKTPSKYFKKVLKKEVPIRDHLIRIPQLINSISYVFEDAFYKALNRDTLMKTWVLEQFAQELDKLLEGEFHPEMNWKNQMTDGHALFKIEILYREKLKESAMMYARQLIFGGNPTVKQARESNASSDIIPLRG